MQLKKLNRESKKLPRSGRNQTKLEFHWMKRTLTIMRETIPLKHLKEQHTN